MSKVKRFSLEERYGYQNRKVIYDKNADNDIELNNIYPIIGLLNQFDEQISDLEAKLAEKEREAEWHKEFGSIERTERLELPTWEEISRDLKDVPAGTYVIKEFDDVSLEYIKYNEVFIGIYKGDYEWKEWEATKENYTLACRKAKELFLGEKK